MQLGILVIEQLSNILELLLSLFNLLNQLIHELLLLSIPVLELVEEVFNLFLLRDEPSDFSKFRLEILKLTLLVTKREFGCLDVTQNLVTFSEQGMEFRCLVISISRIDRKDNENCHDCSNCTEEYNHHHKASCEEAVWKAATSSSS